MILNEQQRAEIAEMAESEGYKVLLSLAEAELANKIKMLTEPTNIYEQRLETLAALQGEIRGLKWWIRKVNTIIGNGKED